MIYKRLRRIDRSDRIVRTEHPKGKAFSADDWLIGVVVAACFTGTGLHGVVFHKLYMGLGQRKEWHSDHSYHGYTWTGQAAVVFGIIFIAFGLLASTKIIFANNLSRRWRIIHFMTSVVIACLLFFCWGSMTVKLCSRLVRQGNILNTRRPQKLEATCPPRRVFYMKRNDSHATLSCARCV